jgi:hypothetical protein
VGSGCVGRGGGGGNREEGRDRGGGGRWRLAFLGGWVGMPCRAGAGGRLGGESGGGRDWEWEGGEGFWVGPAGVKGGSTGQACHVDLFVRARFCRARHLPRQKYVAKLEMPSSSKIDCSGKHACSNGFDAISLDILLSRACVVPWILLHLYE